jgi:hypothetical protein
MFAPVRAWWNGRHKRLKIARAKPVRVRLPPPAPIAGRVLAIRSAASARAPAPLSWGHTVRTLQPNAFGSAFACMSPALFPSVLLRLKSVRVAGMVRHPVQRANCQAIAVSGHTTWQQVQTTWSCGVSAANILASRSSGNEMVPGEGIEPPTFGLQNRCTAAVLTRRKAPWTRAVPNPRESPTQGLQHAAYPCPPADAARAARLPPRAKGQSSPPRVKTQKIGCAPIGPVPNGHGFAPLPISRSICRPTRARWRALLSGVELSIR